MANDVVRFSSAGLPAADLGKYARQAQEALQEARDMANAGSDIAFLKLGKNDGLWAYGQEKTDIEEGSLWAVNPFSLTVGYIAWPPANSSAKQPIKKLRYILADNQPQIDRGSLGEPANGGTWDPCVGFQLMCVGGTDKSYQYQDVGVTLEYQQNSKGGRKGWDALATALMKQIGADAAHPVPVIELLNSTYVHEKWGQQFNPVFKIHRWIAMDTDPGEQLEDQGDDGQEQAQEPEPPPQRGRRQQAAQPEQQQTRAAEPAKPRQRRGAAQQEQQEDPPQQVDRGVVQRRRRRG